MRLRFSFLLIPVLFVGSVTYGQIHLGATTAYNATFVFDKGLSKDPRYYSTYTYNWAPVGVSLGVDLGRKFGLQLETIKSVQGQIYNVINTAKQVSGTRKIDVEYFNIPLMMKFMSDGTRKTRANFNFGPQLSILSKGTESLTTKAGTYTIPEDVDYAQIQEEYKDYNPVDNKNGTYTLGKDVPTTDLLTKAQNDFKTKEFQLVAAFGMDIDLSKHIYLSTQIRANYSLTDMRNEDVINSLKNGNYSEIFGGRANFLVGLQIGLHYYFGTLRSYK